MTDEQRNAIRENLYNKPIRELVDMLLQAMEELEEAKQLRRRLMQIRNLALDPSERRPQGRPRKITADSSD